MEGRPKSEVAQRIALGAVLAFASAIRLDGFFHRPSLWADEATLAVNLAARSMIELTRPLYFGQTAPIGFLWIERLLSEIFGVNELSLRLWPLLAGLAILWLLPAVSRRFVSPLGTIVIVGAAGLSPALLRYSSEVKPYGPDAFFATLITFLTLRVLEEPDRLRRWHALGATGAIAVMSSFPALLVVGVAGLAVLTAARRHRQWAPLIGWGLVVTLIAGPVVWLGRVPAVLEYMGAFWASAFPTLTGATGIGRESVRIVKGYLGSIPDGGLGIGKWIAPLLVLIAVMPLGARPHRRALLLLGPAVGAAFAGLLHFYPMAFRLWLFTVPGFLVLYVLGVEVIAAWLGRHDRRPLGVAVVGALGGLLWFAAAPRLLPIFVRPAEDGRSAVGWLHQRRSVGETVYVFARALPAWVMYTTDWERPLDSTVSRLLAAAGPGGPLFENRSWPGPIAPGQVDSLVRTSVTGDEVFGVPTGLLRYYGGPEGIPAVGWAPAELDRIEARLSRCAAIFASHASDLEVEPILAEFHRRGWREASRFDHRLSPVIRFCRPA